MAIQLAQRKLGSYTLRLDEGGERDSYEGLYWDEGNEHQKATTRQRKFELFTSCEPCAMCLGAIIHSRISRVVFGAFDKKTGACGSCFNLLENNCFNHRPELLGGVLEEKCAAILKNFFLKKRF